jgi:hypothetical protein
MHVFDPVECKAVLAMQANAEVLPYAALLRVRMTPVQMKSCVDDLACR